MARPFPGGGRKGRDVQGGREGREVRWSGTLGAAAGGGQGEYDRSAMLLGEEDCRLEGNEDSLVKVGIIYLGGLEQVCGGQIGKLGDHFCTRETCTVQAHLRNKANLEPDCLYICAPKAHVAFTQPSLDAACAGPCLDDTLSLRLEVAEWLLV